MAVDRRALPPVERAARRERVRRRRQQQPLAAVKPEEYWERRYAAGGNSGAGSQGVAASAKAAYISRMLRRRDVSTVVDWGCGDGTVLALLDLTTAHYLGVEVSRTALVMCLDRRPDAAYLLWRDGIKVNIRADLALSIDVLFHLVYDEDFATYWDRLFSCAARFVLAHGTDFDGNGAQHVRHRRISHRAPAGWDLVDRADDPTVPGFYLWRRA